MMSRIVEIKNLLKNLSFKQKKSSKDVKIYENVFGKNDYSKDDKFIYVKVPDIRRVAKDYGDLKLTELQELIKSEINEERLLALIILVNQYNKNSMLRNDIFNFYLTNISHINNWNLVDSSAHYIVGAHLFNKLSTDDNLLFRLAKSSQLFERRIAVLSTFYFIKQNHFELTLNLAQLLLNDEHHLIHKAVGWMLREIGKKNETVLTQFLDTNSAKMPRTMLRYSIERLTQNKRKHYLAT